MATIYMFRTSLWLDGKNSNRFIGDICPIDLVSTARAAEAGYCCVLRTEVAAREAEKKFGWLCNSSYRENKVIFVSLFFFIECISDLSFNSSSLGNSIWVEIIIISNYDSFLPVLDMKYIVAAKNVKMLSKGIHRLANIGNKIDMKMSGTSLFMLATSLSG